MRHCLKQASSLHVRKAGAVTAKAEGFGMYGLVDNNDVLYCCPCGRKTDRVQTHLLTKHVATDLHDSECTACMQNHLQERLLRQAQVQAPDPPPPSFWGGHSV